MSEEKSEKVNYEKIKLKCGLEIHQQLNTGKLFCNCPSVLRQDEPDFTITRKLHAVAGEAGVVDEAAEYQAGLDKEFIYQGYDTTCLVEIDEEPPHQINQEALEIGLQIAHLLNAKIIPITQIMRKTVIDGSNTSGFQRTVMIARDGFIETSFGKVGVASICLEEDSARIVKNEKDKVIYRLDRLGIPLVEIATEPDIKTPEQAKETALHLGEILRSCNVRRGLGTIRQDVNLSVNYPKGKRIELKGFQDVRNIEVAIEKEVVRQIGLIEKGKSVSEVRRVSADGDGGSKFLRPMPGAARMYPETDLTLLKISRKMIDDAKKNLPKLKKDIEEELKREGLPQELVSLLLKNDKIEQFKEFLKILRRPNLIGKIILVYPKEIAGREKKSLEEVEEILNEDILGEVLEYVKKGEFDEGNVKSVLEKIVAGENLKDALKSGKESVENVEEKILKIIKSKPGLSENAYMGLVMKEFKGKISGKEAMEIIEKLLK